MKRFAIYDPDDQAFCLTGTFTTAEDAEDFIKKIGKAGLMCDRPQVLPFNTEPEPVVEADPWADGGAIPND